MGLCLQARHLPIRPLYCLLIHFSESRCEHTTPLPVPRRWLPTAAHGPEPAPWDCGGCGHSLSCLICPVHHALQLRQHFLCQALCLALALGNVLLCLYPGDPYFPFTFSVKCPQCSQPDLSTVFLWKYCVFPQTFMWLPYYIAFKYLYFILACELPKERVSVSIIFVIQHRAQCLHLIHVVDI